jgi:hypothetical protein
MLWRAQTSTANMKTKLILLPLLLASLCLSSCVSYSYTLGAGWSDSPASRCKRLGVGAIDLVTLPVQLPLIAAVKISE